MNNINNNQEQRRELTPEQAKKQILRNELKERSIKARDFREKKIREAENTGNAKDVLYWESRTINDILIMWEKQKTGATQFNKAKEWNELGFLIKKGEKAFRVWSRPITANQSKENSQEPKENKKELDFNGNADEQNNDEFDFFGMCCLFSDLQVEKKNYQINKKYSKKYNKNNINSKEIKKVPPTFETVILD